MHEAADHCRPATFAALGAAPELLNPGKGHGFSTSVRPLDKAVRRVVVAADADAACAADVAGVLPKKGTDLHTESEWQTGPEAWKEFVRRHPELGLKPGKWPFHNFLRLHRPRLIASDAIRLAQRRFWVAHVERLCSTAFECATGFDSTNQQGDSE